MLWLQEKEFFCGIRLGLSVDNVVKYMRNIKSLYCTTYYSLVFTPCITPKKRDFFFIRLK
jgi:hypothetical protein